jgi:hypothetical protein
LAVHVLAPAQEAAAGHDRAGGVPANRYGQGGDA